MKLTKYFFVLLLSVFAMNTSSAFVVATPATIVEVKPVDKKESIFKQLTAEEMFTMPRADIEEKIGRKLKFKERLGLKIIQKAAKKAEKRMKKKGIKKGQQNENLFGILSISLGGAGLLSALFSGYGALSLGIAGLALGIVGLKRDEPKRILSILGIVFGGLVILFALLVLIVLAALLI